MCTQKRATPRCDFSRIAAGKTIFLHFRRSHETTRSMIKQINSIDTGLGKLLGYYPNIQHAMLHRNAAQQRPGYLPSAPQAFQKLLRAQNQANGCTASQRRQSQPGDTTAAERPAGTMDTTHISLIYDGTSSPQPRKSTDGCSTSAESTLHETILSEKDTSRPARNTKKSRTTLRLQQLVNTHTPHY